MNTRKKILLVLVLLSSSLFAGCVDQSFGTVTVVQEKSEKSFDLLKGIVYDIDIWVKNEATVSKSARVTIELIAESTGKVRDSKTQTVDLKSDETKHLKFTLDGEQGIDYLYKYYVNEI